MIESSKSTIDSVIEYLKLGIYSVPIPHGEKGPRTPGWQNSRLDEEGLRRTFRDAPLNNGMLLGEPSGGLTDVDLDCQETVAMASDFLPPTGRMSGRESKPKSHRWYICHGARTKQFKDTDGKMLVEIRSTNGQTLAPPSVHPSGEPCVWYEEGEFSETGPDALLGAVERLASAALLARNWPAQGSRHKGSLAIAGLLLRGGIPSELAKKIIGSAARGAGDEEWENRVQNVGTTEGRINENQPATGAPTAVEIFGGAVVDQLTKWLGLQAASSDAEDESSPTQADQLEEMAIKQATFCHTPAERTFATFPVDGHRETWPVADKRFRRWMNRIYSAKKRRSPNRKTMDDVILRLEERALFEGERSEVHVRLAGHDGAIYLDLGREDWGVVKIAPDGWGIVNDPPVKFRRPKGLLPSPTPVRGGSIDELRPFINCDSDEDWILIVSFLMAAFRPTGPHPVLALFGEQGSAKSTTASVLRSLVDPGEADRRTQPKDVRDLFIAANNSWLLNYDNLSFIDSNLSDALCQIATGGAMSTRALYTDDGEYIAKFQRPVIINGIEEVMYRSDLIDRSIILTLPVIPEEDRRSEAGFWQSFNEAAPRILGAILDVVSDALKTVPNVRLDKTPRMADFALWATACEGKLGLKPGAFMEAYNLNREDMHQLAIASSPVAQAVQNLIAEHKRWKGTPTELYAVLGEVAGVEKQARSWPANAQKLSGVLTRLTPNLRALGIQVAKGKQDKFTRTITISKPGV